jgi:hypothetical protein
MLDLDGAAAQELDVFTAEVQDRLATLFGPSSLAEHGRVAACVAPHFARHEPHCLHAHRLVFPRRTSLTMVGTLPRLNPTQYASFADARKSFRATGQYLYVEDASGRCELVAVRGPIPRQFLRLVAAAQAGRPELADWRSRPGLDEVELARHQLMRFTAK